MQPQGPVSLISCMCFLLLLVFYTNYIDLKRTVFELEALDRQADSLTDGSQRCLIPPIWWRGIIQATVYYVVR